MSWNTPQDWSVGEVAASAKLNAQLRDNMRELWHEIFYVEWTGTKNPGDTVVDSGVQAYVALPIFIEFFAPRCDAIGTPGVTLDVVYANLFDGATNLGRIASMNASSNGGGEMSGMRRMTPSAANHQYLITITKSGGDGTGTGSVQAGAGGPNTLMPGYIRIWQKGGP
jgi:hypothetical protein